MVDIKMELLTFSPDFSPHFSPRHRVTVPGEKGEKPPIGFLTSHLIRRKKK